ncbi:MAG TPA: type II toxin-antitoxin system VapC family toxin [Conexibacter sp.]
MILPDVNVLVGAHRTDQESHDGMRDWLVEEVSSERPFALADLAMAGFLRVVTNPRIFATPSPLRDALRFLDGLFEQPTCVPVAAGPRHWGIVRRVIVDADARGNLVPDAHLAAIAIEHGATVATRDRGFARFAGVRWIDPLA